MFGSSERLVSLAGHLFVGERTSWKQALSVNVKYPCADEDAHEPCSGSRTVWDLTGQPGHYTNSLRAIFLRHS